MVQEGCCQAERGAGQEQVRHGGCRPSCQSDTWASNEKIKTEKSTYINSTFTSWQTTFLPQFLTNTAIYQMYPSVSEQGRTWKERLDYHWKLCNRQVWAGDSEKKENEESPNFCLIFPFLKFRMEMGSRGTGKYPAKYGTDYFTSVQLVSYAVSSCSGSVIFRRPSEQQKRKKNPS